MNDEVIDEVFLRKLLTGRVIRGRRPCLLAGSRQSASTMPIHPTRRLQELARVQNGALPNVAMIHAPVNTGDFSRHSILRGGGKLAGRTRCARVRLYSRHGTGCAIKRCDVGKERKLEHAKREAARAHSRKFFSGSARCKPARPG
jgi:hypothetical protein